MPAIAPAVLINSILNAIQQSGGSGVYLSAPHVVHPRIFAVDYFERPFTLWVYIWTLTRGGRSTLPNEYRIQMTSVQSPLPLNPDGYTVLLGYYPDLEVFAGFDIQRHQNFTAGSPSVQISIDTIQNALQDGLAFATKDNEEIAIGIRPDLFLHYVLNAPMLHQSSDSEIVSLLSRAVQRQDIPAHDISDLTVDRQRIVTNVARYSRSANFRQQVLCAYDHRCAVTRAQLRLVESAHILPVPAPNSSDHISNGIALSPTMHKAFDNALIYLDSDYFMRLNNAVAEDLRQRNLLSGLEQISFFLDRRIHLPSDQNQWPNTEFIIRANQYRQIPGFTE
ncbi:MAG TPA: HNH endonuclease [Syntrophorhabdaceae bacterium]|nr:HNH endonuclease [Syntrophorhabdaceae bacterium]